MKRALCVFLFSLLAGALAVAQNAVPFVLQPLRPMSAAPGLSSLTLTVTGVGFVSGSTVNWNGSARATTFVSSTKLTAAITSADLAHAGIAVVTVTTPAPGGGASNPVFFPVHQKAAVGGFARHDTVLANTVSALNAGGQVFTGDFNNDGKLDLVISSQSSATASLEVFLGNGDGTFQTPVFSTQSFSAAPVAVADFNGDGKLDVAAEGSFGTLLIYLGNGDGTLTEQPTNYGNSYASYGVADINGDGKLDLVVNWGEEGAYGTSIMLGNGDGTFGGGPNINFGAAGLSAVSDYNRDGFLDLAIPAFTDMEVAFGRSGGIFNTPAQYNLNGYTIYGLWAADLNNDGKPDLLSDAGLVFLNQGSGTFNVPSSSAIPNGASAVQFLDANGDGKLDVLSELSVQGLMNSAVYAGNGDGTFQNPVDTVAGWGGTMPTYADFNGDGRVDFAVFGTDLITGSPILSVYLQNDLQISNGIINFDQVKLGTSVTQTSVLTNTGKSTLSLGTIALASLAPSYTVTSGCGTSLAPGASCTVTITFAPLTKKELFGRVKVPFTGTIGGPQYIELAGLGY
jgi:uncharacterized protein (DUF2141 family)